MTTFASRLHPDYLSENPLGQPPADPGAYLPPQPHTVPEANFQPPYQPQKVASAVGRVSMNDIPRSEAPVVNERPEAVLLNGYNHAVNTAIADQDETFSHIVAGQSMRLTQLLATPANEKAFGHALQVSSEEVAHMRPTTQRAVVGALTDYAPKLERAINHSLGKRRVKELLDEAHEQGSASPDVEQLLEGIDDPVLREAAEVVVTMQDLDMLIEVAQKQGVNSHDFVGAMRRCRRQEPFVLGACFNGAVAKAVREQFAQVLVQPPDATNDPARQKYLSQLIDCASPTAIPAIRASLDYLTWQRVHNLIGRYGPYHIKTQRAARMFSQPAQFYIRARTALRQAADAEMVG